MTTVSVGSAVPRPFRRISYVHTLSFLASTDERAEVPGRRSATGHPGTAAT